MELPSPLSLSIQATLMEHSQELSALVLLWIVLATLLFLRLTYLSLIIFPAKKIQTRHQLALTNRLKKLEEKVDDLIYPAIVKREPVHNFPPTQQEEGQGTYTAPIPIL
jgi:hypothetical protein